MHSSLDGFAATEDGGLDWISFTDEQFKDVEMLTHDADAALYGRKTYDMMEGYWPTAAGQPNASVHDKEHAAWYNSVTKYVVSRANPKTGSKAEVIGQDLEAEVKKLKSQPGKNILMIGSPGTAQSLMQLGLIDEYALYLNPIVLSKGIKFYPQTNERVQLSLANSKTYQNGVVGLTYSLKK